MKFCFVTIIFALVFLQSCAVDYSSKNLEQNSNRAENRVLSENTRTENVSATPKPTAETPPRFDSVEINDAAAVIRDYYAAVNNRNYQKAFELWSGKGEASKQTFEEFKNGFAETAAVEIKTGEPGKMEAAAGSRYITLPLVIEAKTVKGETQKFAGEYVLRRIVVDGATAEQRAWRIYSADIKRRN